MRSLKTARPLLTSVAYFVLFAIILFSWVQKSASSPLSVFDHCLLATFYRIIGVQSFKGSLLRSCFVSPTLGEQALQLNQFCGGYIDPNTTGVTNYVQLDGTPGSSKKGYICPLGQVCKV